MSFFVRRMRLELTRSCDHYPLKVACIPISPPAREHFFVPRTGLEPARLSTLAPETSASTIPPLGHKKKSGKRDSNSRPQPWQGCALPTELFPQFPFCECKGNAFSENHKIIHDFFLLNSLSLLNTSDSYSRHKNNFYRLQFVHQNVGVR